MEIRLPPRFNLLAILSGTAALNLLPLLGLFFYCLSRPGGAFSALGREGFEQLGNTLLLLLLVAIGVGCLGTAIGFLITRDRPEAQTTAFMPWADTSGGGFTFAAQF